MIKRRVSLFLVVVAVVSGLSGCRSMRVFTIETYNPAEVTFPPSVGKVLVVNNALPQPADVGYNYLLLGEKQDTAKAFADSALVHAVQSLGESLAGQHFFNDVLLLNGATRTDNRYLDDTKLLPSQVDSLLESTSTDAIISVDRLLFKMDRVVDGASGLIVGAINVKIGGVVRVYLPRREQPLATVLLSDSVMWSEAADEVALLHKYLPSPSDALTAAGSYAMEKVYSYFVPYWGSDSRWWYTSSASRWKEASAAVSKERWDKAIGLWQRIIDANTDGLSKAKAASNIAMANEMKGNFEVAYEWAQKARDLFVTAEGDEGDNVRLARLYANALLQRIRAEKMLRMQIR